MSDSNERDRNGEGRDGSDRRRFGNSGGSGRQGGRSSDSRGSGAPRGNGAAGRDNGSGQRRDSSGGGGYGGQRRDGDRRGSGDRREGGYPPRRDSASGGYSGKRRDGDNRGSGERREGGFAPRRDGASGGYGGQRRDGDNRGSGERREGGYPPRRDGASGGYGGQRRDGGYAPRRDGASGGYGGQRRDGDNRGSGERREGGYPPRRDGASGGYGGDRRSSSSSERRPWTPRDGGGNGPSDRPRSERPRTDRGHAERGGRGREKAPWRPTGQHSDFSDVDNGPDLRSVRTRHDDPAIPAEVEASELDKGARIQLKTLEKENANDVARHLVMAARLIDEDPELAHRHALSAARRGGRIAIVRESVAITAYATGDFALALRELRTFRRISGSNDQLPLMVDSERGVGRPDRALELGRSVPRESLPTDVRVGLAIAMSGARLDLGQTEEALAELEIPELDRTKAFSYSPMLFQAYAEVLDELGQTAKAEEWHEIARVAAEALDDEIDDVMTVVEVANPDYVEEVDEDEVDEDVEGEDVGGAAPVGDDDSSEDSSEPSGKGDGGN